ncbi:MAG: hypothetical protein IT269_02725 [Saprospiraceae bacterium]|nr:hypothetical protein [Saprospiraceae bacterium]
MNLTRIFTLLLMSVLLFACGKEDEPPADTTEIFPGEGLKSVKIGDQAYTLFNVYGNIAGTYYQIGSYYYHAVYYIQSGITANFEPTTDSAIASTLKIASFSLTPPFSGKTAKGIGIGSNRTDVVAAYGNPEIGGATDNVVAYVSLGMAITYENDKIVGITLEKP